MSEPEPENTTVSSLTEIMFLKSDPSHPCMDIFYHIYLRYIPGFIGKIINGLLPDPDTDTSNKIESEKLELMNLSPLQN